MASALFTRRMLICVFTGFSSGLPLDLTQSPYGSGALLGSSNLVYNSGTVDPRPILVFNAYRWDGYNPTTLTVNWLLSRAFAEQESSSWGQVYRVQWAWRLRPEIQSLVQWQSDEHSAYAGPGISGKLKIAAQHVGYHLTWLRRIRLPTRTFSGRRSWIRHPSATRWIG